MNNLHSGKKSTESTFLLDMNITVLLYKKYM